MSNHKFFSHPDHQYLNLVDDVLQFGEERKDRTGTGTISLFAPPPLRFDLTQGFPLLTTKKLHIPSIVHELLWFLKGDTGMKYLLDNDIKIWNGDAIRWFRGMNPHMYDWADEEILKILQEHDFNLGPIYGAQWRRWRSPWRDEEGAVIIVDQVHEMIKLIKEDPTSRRILVSAWNPGQQHKMALPPCHLLFQGYVHNDGGFSLQMYQRSADVFLGEPFNIASYALLTHLIAHVTGLYAKDLTIVLGDAHIYLNHLEQLEIQSARVPKELPTLKLNPEIKDINDFTFGDIEFEGYDPHPGIKGKVSVG